MTKADKEGQKKTPILRFKGFTDDWEQRKLENLGNIRTGNTPSKSHTKYYSSNNGKESIPWVTPTDINSEYTTQTNLYLTSEGQKYARIVPPDTLLMTCIASIGKNTISTDVSGFNQQINAIIPNDKSNIRFLYFISFKISKYMNKIAPAGMMPIINKTEFSKIKVYIPVINEQNKISNLMEKLNYLLTLYERKYQLYLLQFQKLQRVIFDNSDDFISLSYLIEIKTGNRNSQDNVKNGKYVFFDRSTEIKRLNEFDFDEEAIIIPGEGTKFAPKYINGKYALHQRSYSLYNFSQEIDSKYLYYFLMTQSNTLLRYSVGTTVPSLRVSTFDHIKVPMYSKELQIKYALTFDSLEKLMNQIKKKTNILRSLKRFLLQVLFL
ncbi:restriction endonuclease subunit S [Ligilactobacillus aviarius]|uniref:restriction endonuclease subunit S n=1 Tax=Ligilactobacillus aviarius TaxID=1606 RepID=UPI0024BA17EA|nr:restriction endonuclease subunit S [Ligilactobacillus aviarius]